MDTGWLQTARWGVSFLTKGTSLRARLFLDGFNTLSKVRAAVEDIIKVGVLTDIVTLTGKLEGTWRTGRPVWRRDAGERRGGDATYTLLVDVVSAPAVDAAVGGDSCSEFSRVEYHWDEPLPPPETVASSGPGVVVRTGGVSKDPETGFWNWYVETTTSKHYTLLEYTAEEGVFQRQKQRAELNLRIAANGTATDETGTAVALPTPGVSAGTAVTQSRKKNPDCTTDVQITTTEAKRAGRGEVRVREFFAEQDTVEVDNDTAAALPAVVLAADGTITKVSSKRNDLGMWDTGVTTVKPLQRSWSWRDQVEHNGELGIVYHYEFRNWPEKPAIPDIDSSSPDGASPGGEFAVVPEGYYVTSNFDRNAHGLWDGSHVVRPVWWAFDGGPGEADYWIERSASKETTSSRPKLLENMCKANWSTTPSEEESQNPHDGFWFRWVYEKAKVRIFSNRHSAEAFVDPNIHTGEGGTDVCLPDSYCKPAGRGNLWYARRVVGRKYTKWCVDSERAATMPAISELAGAGDIS